MEIKFIIYFVIILFLIIYAYFLINILLKINNTNKKSNIYNYSKHCRKNKKVTIKNKK